MTKGIEFVFDYLPLILDRKKVCDGCRDRSKCAECSFNPTPETNCHQLNQLLSLLERR
jgi:hypothetical protein